MTGKGVSWLLLIIVAACFWKSAISDDECSISIAQIKKLLAKNSKCSENFEDVNKLANDIKLDIAKLTETVGKLTDLVYKFLSNNLRQSELEELKYEGCPGLTSLSLITLSNGEKYYFSNKHKLSWFEAKAFCEQNKMLLASAQTQEKLSHLHKEAKRLQPSAPWWLSASDIGRQPGQFKWQNGESLDVNSPLWNKKKKQPDHYGKGQETCVDIFTEDPEKLVDWPCHGIFHFICELPAECY